MPIYCYNCSKLVDGKSRVSGSELSIHIAWDCEVCGNHLNGCDNYFSLESIYKDRQELQKYKQFAESVKETALRDSKYSCMKDNYWKCDCCHSLDKLKQLIEGLK